jgi:hypothetical protein
VDNTTHSTKTHPAPEKRTSENSVADPVKYVPTEATIQSAIPGAASTGTKPFPSEPTATQPKDNLIVEGATQAPNLKGVVDLTNTVDTDVTTKALPGNTPSRPLAATSRLRSTSIPLNKNFKNQALIPAIHSRRP